MDFSWSGDQLSFRDASRDLLVKECQPSVVRRAWDAPPGELDREVWYSLDRMGVLSVLLDEDAGGLGLDELYLIPVLEETGRVALPHPVVETAMVAARLGLSGRMFSAAFGSDYPTCAADADAIIVEHSGALHLLDPDTVAPLASVDRSRRLGQASGSRSLITDDPIVVRNSFDRGVLGVAAQLVGLARSMLELTVRHVTERQQFGVPIGSFQAVKHHLADALLAIEFASPAVARAAWSVAHAEDTIERDVSMAKALATDAAERAGSIALQCHGAIGYTVEHDLHLFLKRAWALARSWGDRAYHADRVGRAIGARP